MDAVSPGGSPPLISIIGLTSEAFRTQLFSIISHTLILALALNLDIAYHTTG